MSQISLNSTDAEKIRDARAIIWDEATMASATMIRCASNCVADVCCSLSFFPNKVVLFGGDFRQCLPVVRGGSRTEILENSLNRSRLWVNFRVIRLEQNMRAQEDPRFALWLLRVGDGLDGEMAILPNTIMPTGNLIEEVFGTNEQDCH